MKYPDEFKWNDRVKLKGTDWVGIVVGVPGGDPSWVYGVKLDSGEMWYGPGEALEKVELQSDPTFESIWEKMAK